VKGGGGQRQMVGACSSVRQEVRGAMWGAVR
jgi:hypothetical protein